jgi:hypothetical protein
MGELRNIYKILVGISESKRLLRGPRHRWEDIIGMDLREIVWEGVDCWLRIGTTDGLM